jgi:hypothetical protein
MLTFFSKGFFTQYATVFMLGVLLWLPAALTQPVIEEPNQYWGILARFLFYSNGSLPVLSILLAYLLTFITGLFINKMATDYGLTGKTSTLPLFVYILMTGFSPSFHSLSPFIFMLPLLTLLYHLLFKHYHKENNIFLSFDTGIILGIATLIYPPLAIMIIAIWISLLTFKGISWRNFPASLMGLLFPAFMVYSYYFFTGHESLVAGLFPIKSLLNFNLFYFPFTLNSLLNLLLALFVLIAAVKVMQQQKNLSIQQRNHFTVVGVSLLFLLFIQLFLSLQLTTTLLLVPAGALTVSNIISNSLLKPKWSNLMLVAFVIISLFNSFLPFINAAR